MPDSSNNKSKVKDRIIFYTKVNYDSWDKMCDSYFNKYLRHGRDDDNTERVLFNHAQYYVAVKSFNLWLRPAEAYGSVFDYEIQNNITKPCNIKNDQSNIEYKLVTPNVFIDDAIKKLDRLIDNVDKDNACINGDYRIFTSEEMKTHGAKYQYKGRMYT